MTSFHDGSSTSAPLTGVNYNAVYDECPSVAYAGIALEYGTLPMMAVLQALRGDQWLENHPDAPAEVRRAIKRSLRDALLPGCRRLEAHGATRQALDAHAKPPLRDFAGKPLNA